MPLLNSEAPSPHCIHTHTHLILPSQKSMAPHVCVCGGGETACEVVTFRAHLNRLNC